MPDYAVYGIHFYGTARYGRPPLFDFALDYFEAKPQGYDRIKVEWGHPSGAWDQLRLVRGNYGFPVDEIDGRILLEATNVDAGGVPLVASLPTDPGTIEDTSVSPLRFHYYSIFLRQTSSGNWVRAGNAPALMTKDYSSAARLYELVPQVFRDDDTVFISSYTGVGLLESFFEVLGYQIDILRSEIESLLWTADPVKMSGGLLPVLAAALGFPYEAELGMALARRQLLNAVYLYRTKGTRLGVEGAVSVLTGWAPIVVADTPTHLNIALRADRINRVTNPSAEVSAAGWTQGANTTLTRTTSQHAYGAAAFQLAATAGGNVSMTTATGLSGMPVTEGVSYVASIYSSKPAGTVRNVRTDLLWYDAAGAQIGSTDLGDPIPQVLGAWTARPSLVATAPPGAKTAAMRASVIGAAAGENQYLDGALFEQAIAVGSYFDGSVGSPIADYLWEGTVGLSRTHYYHRRALVNSRLITRLPDFLPAGFTFTQLWAQPL